MLEHKQIKKYFTILLVIGIISITVSILSKIFKITYISIYPEDKASIAVVIVPSLITLGIKLKIYVPKINKLNKLIKDHNDDTSIIKRIFKINKILVVVYTISLSINIIFYYRHGQNLHDLISIITVSIILIIDGANMVYSGRLNKHFYG